MDVFCDDNITDGILFVSNLLKKSELPMDFGMNVYRLSVICIFHLVVFPLAISIFNTKIGD